MMVDEALIIHFYLLFKHFIEYRLDKNKQNAYSPVAIVSIPKIIVI